MLAALTVPLRLPASPLAPPVGKMPPGSSPKLSCSPAESALASALYNVAETEERKFPNVGAYFVGRVFKGEEVFGARSRIEGMESIVGAEDSAGEQRSFGEESGGVLPTGGARGDAGSLIGTVSAASTDGRLAGQWSGAEAPAPGIRNFLVAALRQMCRL